MGEVLFRSYGLSGIVIFNLSRRAQVGDLIALDLTPGLPTHEIVALADPAGRGRVTDGALDGVLDPTIAAAVIEQARSGIGAAGRNVTHDVGGFTETERVASLVKELPFVVTGPAETQHAQVTRGGLATAQFDPRTLAARSYHWLFAAGEALDVDGDCGGFNLAWAWRSGMVAGAATVLIWHNMIKPMGAAVGGLGGSILGMYELLPAFLIGCLAIFVVSKLTPEPEQSVLDTFDHYMDSTGARRNLEEVLEENMASDLPEGPATSYPEGRKK
jgi:hypothetical protein